jgi:hypothetical protein
MAFVEIAVSADMKEWRVIRERAPIYVLEREGRGTSAAVSYPDSRSRYVRIRVLDGSTDYTIAAAKLGYDVYVPAERAPVDAGLAATAPGGTVRQSVWASQRDLSLIPIAAVSFTTSQASFSRSVVIATSTDGSRWTTLASDTITTQEGAETRAKLTVEGFPEVYARRWRITVDHHNDAPIPDLQPTLLTVPRHVVFRPEARQSYRLLFGHPRVPAPQYDLSQLVNVTILKEATLGPIEENAAWVDPTPWTERYDAVLWTAVMAAAILLSLAAMRSLRAPATNTISSPV